ncbi:hypothetical protein DM02DRAFT_665402 [Periconia macrospinosa]|uniref:Uncharacterized protein n=1 Tax=Periconia macrospinosa TaxID=97972 RepID=A0A2V1CWV3_9PLEO|nr:hypothetical protein DM02DRAFT_665402 [Periconia macrospinosa]
MAAPNTLFIAGTASLVSDSQTELRKPHKIRAKNTWAFARALRDNKELVVQEAEPTVKKDTKARLKLLFQKQHVQQAKKLKERKEQIL